MGNKVVKSSNYVNKDLSLTKVRLPKKYRQFMRQVGMRDVYEVPVRKNGMTGSGNKGQCHGNASKLQALYGGKVVSGFAISRERLDDSRIIMTFISHSVWQTPEDKLVDVTLNWKDDDTVWFSPLVSFDVTKESWDIIGDFTLPTNYKKKGLYLGSPHLTENGERMLQHIPFSSVLNKEIVVKRSPRQNLDDIDWLDPDGNPISEFGGFTERSSATGKSWNQIWERYSFSDKPEIGNPA